MPAHTKFQELKQVFKTLHGPGGCLWDKKQTHETIIPHLREEVREFIAAVKNKNVHNMKEELGDLLLHVMFNAQIAAKAKKFDIEDVIKVLIAKLKRRHPHVFGKTKVRSTRQIRINWNKIKREEKRRAHG
ncbi:MAG: MazG nucleotide pyrophosphohydrolase domain-containing protein [Candidatus Omnitrophota bacterium]|jgi:tetrapyrrole methylase family protein/MazG family protein